MTHPTEAKLPESLEVVAYLLEGGRTWKPRAMSTTAHELAEKEAQSRKDGSTACALVRLTDAESALKARDAEIERLRGDAERYRWLRDEAHPDRDDTGISVSEADFNDWGNRFTRYFSGAELDAAIDQARATGGEKAK